MPRAPEFDTQIVGLTHDGDDGPFSTLRVTSSFTIQISPWGTRGGEHLAFAITKPEFDDAFDRLKTAAIPYGDGFASVRNMQGPGDEAGSRGMGKSVVRGRPSIRQAAAIPV